MSESVTVSSLLELVERLFAKPPSIQKVSEESAAPYLNSLVSDVGEASIKDLLAAENISSPKEQREYNEHVSTGTLLHLLAYVGRHEAAEWLLKTGAYVHCKNTDGSTPLHVAALNHHPETIRVLRFFHADAHTENRQGKTAVDFSEEDDVKEALLEHRFSAETVEDEFLQERFEGLVERITNPKSPEDELQSLFCLRSEIRISTASMTSVPKPLKFLRDHFTKLEEVYEKMVTSDSKLVLADVLSVLAMAVEDTGNKCLNYRLEGSKERVSSFGHPYIRRLCSQLPDVWTTTSSPEETLLALVRDICVYCLKHSAEAEACDLLMEVEKVELIGELVSEDIYERVCLYLTSCVKYVPEPEDSVLLNTALKIFRQFHCYPQALRLALMLNDHPLVKELFLECPNKLVRKQLAFILARQQVFLELDDAGLEETVDLTDIMSNVLLNNNFLALARELDIMDPKVPEDIYKTHLEHARFSTANTVDSARANLASSFVNGFVNCGFGEDKLLTADGNKWIYKHKSYGMMSATASLGLILLWDVDGGLTQIDKLLYTNDDFIKAGALLALGLVNVGVRNECDPALALLTDYVLHPINIMRLGSVIGLGLAYAGSMRDDVIDVLTPVMWEEKTTFEVVCLGALSSALVAVGSCNGELTESYLQIMMERDPADLTKTSVRYLALALALLYLGKQEAVDATMLALKVIPEPLYSFAAALLETCAYAGTGNVLKIQSLLHVCSEFHKPKPEGEESEETEEATTPPTATSKGASKTKGTKDKGKKPDKESEPGSLSEPGSYQSISVLGIALIAMGEDIGAEMAMRTFNHLLHYGDPPIRRAVPLALALLSTSNPKLPVLDMLHKFSHDSDPTVARNAVFSMGIVGCGTNNARLAGMLRNLAQFYHKEPQDLFMVRLAQGLTHLGKGTLTLNPYHSDRMLLSPVALAGLLIAMISMLDSSNIILKDAHYMMFYMAPAIQTRMLVTFDESLNPLPVTVRVGQAVDVVGQAGKPKTITGFQTHTTPVLLGYGERAELATEEYVSLTPIVEGFVILKKNPDYEE